MGKRVEELTPAYSIHPGEMLLDEILANGYSQASFAKEIGENRSQINEVIKGKRDINAKLAILLEATLGLSAQYWMNLQTQYDIDKVRIEDKAIQRIKAIEEYNEVEKYIPKKYLKKQFVISGDPMKDLSKVYDVYQVDNLAGLVSECQSLQYARFRKSETLNVDTTNLIGWVKFSEYTANNCKVAEFNPEGWEELKSKLRKILYRNKDVHSEAKNVLGEYGIKLLYQEKAEKVPVDGYAFWNNNNPTISMTLRHKRLDNFAFTLFHELGHVFLHLIDDQSKEIIDLQKDDIEFKKSKEEVEADTFALENLIPKESWDYFMLKSPISESMIREFAYEIGMNPSIIFGRYCYENKRYNFKTGISHSIG